MLALLVFAPGTRLSILPMLSGALLLASCASVPSLGPAPRLAEPHAFASERSFAGTVADWPAASWWTSYGDSQLDRLMAEAVERSPTMAEAQARIDRAAANAGAARAALRPSLSANGSALYAKPSENAGLPVPGDWEVLGEATLDFAFELDFWGKNRASLAAAISDERATQADAAAARLVLTTALASAYVDLHGLHLQRDVAEDSLRVREGTRDLARRRFDGGVGTRAELAQGEAGVAAAEADLAALDEALALTRNRIAALVGQGPDRGIDIARPALGRGRWSGLPPRLALELVGRKPEVVAARWRAEAAAERIGVARSRFYPNVNILAFIGFQALGLGNLLDAGSEIGGVGPAISLPIFDGGRLAANYRGARADYALAVAGYDAALVQALREAADAAASLRSLASRLNRTKAALAAREEAYAQARLSFTGGLSDFEAVLIAEDALLDTRRAAVGLQVRSLALDVALIRALGGGFRAGTLPDAEVTS